MTVALQYSTLKNGKLHRHNIVHSSNNQYTILYAILHRSTIQYYVSIIWRQVPTLA